MEQIIAIITTRSVCYYVSITYVSTRDTVHLHVWLNMIQMMKNDWLKYRCDNQIWLILLFFMKGFTPRVETVLIRRCKVDEAYENQLHKIGNTLPQTCKMESFAIIVKSQQPLAIAAKLSILAIFRSYGYGSALELSVRTA